MTCQGLSEGVLFPSCYAIMRHWTTPEERSRMGAIVLTGEYIIFFDNPNNDDVISIYIYAYESSPALKDLRSKLKTCKKGQFSDCIMISKSFVQKIMVSYE